MARDLKWVGGGDWCCYFVYQEEKIFVSFRVVVFLFLISVSIPRPQKRKKWGSEDSSVMCNAS